MNNQINILFYSRCCKTCQELIRLLENKKLLNYFKLLCVDNRLHELPPYITIVPTMIINNINKPLVGKETFQWIEKIEYIKHNNHNIKKPTGPIGYRQSEMGGISDQFAYKDDEKAMPQNYVGVNNTTSIFTAPEQPGIKKNEQIKLINNLKKSRTVQDTEYVNSMKQKQIEAVINYKSS